MNDYPINEVGQRIDQVLKATLEAPVEFTERDEAGFVMMTAELYQRLERAFLIGRVVHVDALTEEEAARYIEAFSRADADDNNEQNGPGRPI